MGEAEEAIAQHFKFCCFEPTNDIIRRSLQMCKTLNQSPEDFVDTWVGFALSKGGNYPLTLDNLENMYRTTIAANNSASNSNLSRVNQAPIQVQSPISNKRKLDDTGEPAQIKTPQKFGTPSKPQASANVQQQQQRGGEVKAQTPGGPSINYADRKDSGKKIFETGPEYLIKSLELKKKPGEYDFAVGTVGIQEYMLKSDCRYMNESLFMRGDSLTNMSYAILRRIVEIRKLQELIENKQVILGRILVKKDKENKIVISLGPNPKLYKKTKPIPLNLQKVDKYSIITGQTVAVKGYYLKKTEDLFIVEDIYTNPIQDCETLPVLPQRLDIVIAAGPFTLKDNLNFEPLQDLLKYVVSNKPDFLILMGPFYDRNYDFQAENIQETYEEFFESLVNTIMGALEKQNTKVILISSARDRHHHVIYPTPPYKLSEKYTNLYLFPDPALINICGLVIGATTVDVLSHLIGKERSSGNLPDRIGRCCKHILKEQCFYPVFPPDKNMRIDYSLLEMYGTMSDSPNLLLLPSNIKHFVKDIDGVVVLNPEHLSKFNSGGTFARLYVDTVDGYLKDKMVCQIIKV